jgi:methyl-accepting chemotaxis protein
MFAINGLRNLIHRWLELFGVGGSRVKKKLVVYFLLISVVSISVSFQLVFEFSGEHLRSRVLDAAQTELAAGSLAPGTPGELTAAQAEAYTRIFKPLDDLAVRTLLLLIVIVGNVLAAFVMFSRDIARPIDLLVDSSRRIVNGDLTARVPALGADELGELGNLVNDMRTNLHEVITFTRKEVERMAAEIQTLDEENREIISAEIAENLSGEAGETVRIGVEELARLRRLHGDVFGFMRTMRSDLNALSEMVEIFKLLQPMQSDS